MHSLITPRFSHLGFILLLLTFGSSATLAQDKVVVIPLGGDVSASQFNDLVREVQNHRVYGNVVSSSGDIVNDTINIDPGIENYSSYRISEGVYRIQIIPLVIQYDFGLPSIVVTSSNLARISNVKDISFERIDNQILYVEFTVELRTSFGTLSDSGFSFQFKFAEPN